MAIELSAYYSVIMSQQTAFTLVQTQTRCKQILSKMKIRVLYLWCVAWKEGERRRRESSEVMYNVLKNQL